MPLFAGIKPGTFCLARRNGPGFPPAGPQTKERLFLYRISRNFPESSRFFGVAEYALPWYSFFANLSKRGILMETQTTSTFSSRQEQTADMLHELGFPSHRLGYKQLCTAIPRFSTDDTQSLTKDLSLKQKPRKRPLRKPPLRPMKHHLRKPLGKHPRPQKNPHPPLQKSLFR